MVTIGYDIQTIMAQAIVMIDTTSDFAEWLEDEKEIELYFEALAIANKLLSQQADKDGE